MNRLNMRMTAVAALVAMCGAGALVGGCSSSSSHAEGGEGLVSRPLVSQTAVEASTSGDGTGLGFFDDLESRPLASQDDAIHACLLLGTGSSGSSYQQRVAMAAQLGYVPEGFDRPARQAVTMGEVAEMAAKVLEGKRPETGEEAIAKLAHREIVPATARANQGLTGAQLVSITGGVRDAMALEGVARVNAPMVAGVPTAVATNAEAAGGGGAEAVRVMETTPGQPGMPSAMPAGMPASNVPPALATKGRSEPLPQIPAGKPAAMIELQDGNTKGSVIGPDDKVITPGQPKKPEAVKAEGTKPAPKPVESKPVAVKPDEPKKEDPKTEEAKPKPKTEWVTGQPLKKEEPK